MGKKDIKSLSNEGIKAILYAAPTKVYEKYWFPYGNAIYSYNPSNGEIKRECNLDCYNPKKIELFCYSENIGQKIIFSPFWARDILIYDIETQSIQRFNNVVQGEVSGYRNAVVFENKVFLLPNNKENSIFILDKLKDTRHIRIVDWKGKEKKCECTSGYAVKNEFLWISAHYSNQVMKLNMQSEQYELIEICKESIGYTGIVIDNDYLWLAESNMGAIVRYNIQNGEIRKFSAPIELDYNSSEKSYVHLQLFDFPNCIVSLPALSNCITVLNKKTEELGIVKLDFFNIEKSKFTYKYGNYSTCSFGKKIDETTLWAQRTWDGEIACININDFTYSTFCLQIKKEYINDMCKQVYRSKEMFLIENVISLDSLISTLNYLNGYAADNYGLNNGLAIWKEICRKK